MTNYRHIVTDPFTNKSFEKDDQTPTLSQEFIDSLPFDNKDNLTIQDIDVSYITLQNDYDSKRQTAQNALDAAWAFITPYFDQPAFLQMENWDREMGPASLIHTYISSVTGWKNAIMYEYLMIKKPSILANLPYDLDYAFIGPPPCTFTDMFLIVNVAIRPNGWTPPDISNYQPGHR